MKAQLQDVPSTVQKEIELITDDKMSEAEKELKNIEITRPYETLN